MCVVNSDPVLTIPLEDGEPALLFRRDSGLSTQNYLSLCSQQPFEAERRGGQPHWSCRKAGAGLHREEGDTGLALPYSWPDPACQDPPAFLALSWS